MTPYRFEIYKIKNKKYFSLAIFFSYALQFYVVMDIIGPNLIKPFVPDRMYMPAEYTTRILLNVFTCTYVRLHLLNPICCTVFKDSKEKNQIYTILEDFIDPYVFRKYLY